MLLLHTMNSSPSSDPLGGWHAVSEWIELMDPFYLRIFCNKLYFLFLFLVIVTTI